MFDYADNNKPLDPPLADKYAPFGIDRGVTMLSDAPELIEPRLRLTIEVELGIATDTLSDEIADAREELGVDRDTPLVRKKALDAAADHQIQWIIDALDTECTIVRVHDWERIE